jgi:hypothetical protein
MMNKVTKKDMYNAIKAIEAVAANEDMVAFIDHEIELLNKKYHGKKKATKTQEENVGIKNTICATLASLDKAVTVTELQNANSELATLSNQRVSALLRQLVDAGEVVRTTDKRKSYFSISAVEDDTETVEDDE